MKRLLFLTLFALATQRAAFPASVDGVHVADTARLGDSSLVLNGAGKRTRYFFNVYVAALYLPARNSDAAKVIADAVPKRLSMTMMRRLSAGQLSGALREGLSRNSSRTELKAIKPQTDSLVTVMKAIGSANEGDVVTIDFLPDGTTRLGINGRALGMPIPGRDFQRAMLQIWLGRDPVQDDLKAALLGR